MNDFETLWKTHSQAVHRFAFHLTDDASLAEDLTSETFVRLWTSRAPLRPTTIRAYLFTITRNLYLAHLRRKHRHLPLSEEPVSTDPGQERALTHDERSRSLTRALQRLGEEDRAALLLRGEQGVGYEELATILGISKTAARVRVHRARLRLKKLMDGKEPSG